MPDLCRCDGCNWPHPPSSVCPVYIYDASGPSICPDWCVRKDAGLGYHVHVAVETDGDAS